MSTSPPAGIFEAMASPAFYPHAVSAIEQRDTHISKVFLTGDYAYKIKKPVYLEFLDFTTLEKRRYFCRQEVVLNRRLAPEVYLEVVPITFKNGDIASDLAFLAVELDYEGCPQVAQHLLNSFLDYTRDEEMLILPQTTYGAI